MPDKYNMKLLTAWEQVYKSGQLTLWIFLSLKDGPKYVKEIQEFVERNAFSTDEKSLYRSLRKFHDLEMVGYEAKDGERGPERKYYYLTDIGKEILEEFVERNLKVFYQPNIVKLIKDSVT